MGRLPHPVGEGERTSWKPKKKHPAKSAFLNHLSCYDLLETIL